MKQIKDYIIIALLVFLLIKTFFPSKNIITIPTVRVERDTTYSVKDSTITLKPQIIQTIPFPVKEITKEYLPDTSYEKLVVQYQELVKKFLASNISKDSVKIDSFGYVNIIDTVSENHIKNRSVNWNLKLPTVTTKIHYPYIPKNKVFFGIGLQGNPTTLVTQFNGNLLFQNKKDNILGVQAGISPRGELNYGVSTYWKIKF